MEAHGDPSRLHEQMIAEPVQIDDQLVIQWLFARQTPTGALSSPADRSSDMKMSVEKTSARQAKGLERLEFLVHTIDLAFQSGYFTGTHFMHVGVLDVGRSRELTANIE